MKLKRFKTKQAALDWLKENGFWHYQSSPTCDWYAAGKETPAGLVRYAITNGVAGSDLKLFALRKTAQVWTLKPTTL